MVGRPTAQMMALPAWVLFDDTVVKNPGSCSTRRDGRAPFRHQMRIGLQPQLPCDQGISLAGDYAWDEVRADEERGTAPTVLQLVDVDRRGHIVSVEQLQYAILAGLDRQVWVMVIARAGSIITPPDPTSMSLDPDRARRA